MERMGERRGACRVLVGDPSEGYNLEDLGLDGRIILKWNFKTWNGEAWTGLIRLRIGRCGGHF